MNFVIGLILVVIISSSLIQTMRTDTVTAGSHSNSISLSTKRFETDSAYILEITIKGVDSKNTNIERSGQKLTLLVKQGSIKQGAAIAGAQIVNYSFRFNKDADMKRLSRKNLKNKIIISAPKK